MDGCLVIHGLTGTPATAATLIDGLLRAGYRVSAPCLAGHGSTVEELGRSTWREWYNTVRISFEALRREVGRVYCAGMSLGALLALKLAIDEGWGVRALALLGTPLKVSLLNRFLIPTVRYTPLRWVVKNVPRDLELSIADPEGQLLYDQISLDLLPSQAVFQLADLQQEVSRDLSRVANPILMLHGQKDRIAPMRNLDLVRRTVKSDIVEVAVFPRSRHVITLDYDREDVVRTTIDFFKRFA